VAAALRLWGIGWGLPQVYEEATPLRHAWDMWGWGPAAAFDPNPHFFNYPSLTIYLQFLAQLVTYLGLGVTGRIHGALDFRALYLLDPTVFFVVGRGITAAFGVGTVLVVFHLARRVAGLAAAVIAAALVAVTPFHIVKSQVVEVDVPLTFFCALFLLLGLRAMERPTLRSFAWTGAALGLAVSTKYTAGLLVIPLIPVWWYARRRVSPARTPAGKTSRRKKAAAPPGPNPWAWAGAALGAAAVVFALTSPFVLLDWGSAKLALAMEREHMRAGHFGVSDSRSWGYYLLALGHDVIGWPGLAVGAAGIAWFAIRGRKPWAVVFAVFVVSWWFAVGSWSMKASRYALPLLPPLAVLAGAALEELRTLRRVPARVVLAVGAAALLLPAMVRLPAEWRQTRPDTRTLARRWIDANVPRGAMVVTEAYGPELLGPLDLIPLEAELRRRVEGTAPVYGVLRIPMLQVHPELSARFYDPALYAACDYLVVSSTVRDRYLADPAGFPVQAAFYHAVDQGLAKVAEFVPDGGPGPTVVVYKNPQSEVPFANRQSVPGPVDVSWGSPYSGEEPFFWYNLGLIYEEFAFLDAAQAFYARGLEFPVLRPPIHADLALAAARCSLKTGRPDQAAQVLEREAARCPNPADRRNLLGVRDRIRRGG